MPEWLSIGLPAPPIVIAVDCAAGGGQTVWVGQSFPLRNTAFWTRESLAMMRVPEIRFALCWRCGMYPPLHVPPQLFAVPRRSALKRHDSVDCGNCVPTVSSGADGVPSIFARRSWPAV